MPVVRFVLDVHGESSATWAASDAVCAALQINNHLQDCGKDFCELDRVYIPLDALARHGASVEELGAPRASAALLSCLHELAGENEALLREGDTLELQVADGRVACEIAVIQAYAREIVQLLKRRDPLSERVHLNKPAMAALSLSAIAGALWRRATTNAPLSRSTPGA
jgi:phytoene/squalene synthetase